MQQNKQSKRKRPQKSQQQQQQQQRKPRRQRQRKQKPQSFVDRALNFGAKYAYPAFKMLTGMGDYQVHNETQKNSLFEGGQYAFKKQKTIITHREYVADVVTNGAANTFNYNTYSINPGESNLFPWLSTIAQNFESYKMLGLVFEYKSMSADALNSVNTALGQVILSVQYDAANVAFTNKQAQEAYDGAISVKPSCSVLLGVECQPSVSVLSQLYIRNATLPPNTAIQFCDMGVFQISTNGFQGSSVNVGELWVTYQVEFVHEKLSIDPSDNYSRYSQLIPTSAFSNFGSATLQQGVAIGPANGFMNFETLPPGQYQVLINIRGPITSTGVGLSGAGLLFNDIYQNNVVSSTFINNVGVGILLMVSITTLIQGAIFNLNAITWTGAATTLDFIVIEAGNPQ